MANTKWKSVEDDAPSFTDMGDAEVRREDGIVITGRLIIAGEQDGQPLHVVQIDAPPNIDEHPLSDFSSWRLV